MNTIENFTSEKLYYVFALFENIEISSLFAQSWLPKYECIKQPDFCSHDSGIYTLFCFGLIALSKRHYNDKETSDVL